jgi:hypothetical protein
MASSQTRLGRLGMGTADPVNKFMRFKNFDAGVTRELKAFDGTAGTFVTDNYTVREVQQRVLPTLSTEPTAHELTTLLTWAFGTGTGSPAVAYTIPTLNPTLFDMLWFPVAGDTFFLTGVGVDNFILRGQVGDILGVDIDGVGQTWDNTHNSFPAITPDETSQPFILADLTATGGAFSFAGNTMQPRGFTLRVAFGIDRERFLNSLTLTRVQYLKIEPTIEFEVPSGDNSGLWTAGIGDCSLTATFVNTNTSAILSVTAPTIRFPAQSPRHEPNAEGFVTVRGTCYRNAGSGSPVTLSLTGG